MAESLPPIDPLAVLEVLERHRVEYVLIGGVAANVHGYPLPTEDVDITPAGDTANLRRLAHALSELGARLRTGTDSAIEFPVDAAMLASSDIWTLSTERGDLDIVLRPDGTAGYADLRRDASLEQLSDSLRVRVASLADIIRSKEAANRAKDQAALPALRRTLELSRKRQTQR